MADEHRDDEPGAVTTFPQRKPPLRLASPGPTDDVREVAKIATNAILQLSPRINELTDDVYKAGTTLLIVEHNLGKLTSKVDDLSDRINAIGEHLKPPSWPPPRRKLPSLREYDPESTPAGGIRVQTHAWEALQQRIAAQEEAMQEAKEKADLAAAEKRGADSALSALEARSENSRRAFKFWMGVAATTAAGLAWLVTHLAHL